MTNISEQKKTIYPDDKRKDELAVNPYMYYVLRPLSFWPTIWLSRIGMSANACTLLSGIVLFLGLASVFLFAIRDQFYFGLTIGAALVNFYYYLDVLDGNIARLNGKTSKLGSFLDETLNSIAGVLVPIAFGLVIFFSPDDFNNMFSFVPDYIWIILGFSIALFRIFRRVITNHVSLLLGTVGDRSNVLGENRTGPKYWASILNSISFPLLFVSALLNLVPLWLIVYSFFNLSVFGYTLLWAYMKLEKVG